MLPPSPPKLLGEEPPDPLCRYACVQVSWDRRLHLLLFFSSEHTMGTPTLVNFMRAVKSARVGSNKHRAEKQKNSNNNNNSYRIKVQAISKQTNAHKNTQYRTYGPPYSLPRRSCSKLLGERAPSLPAEAPGRARQNGRGRVWGSFQNGVPCPCPFPTIWAPDELLE